MGEAWAEQGASNAGRQLVSQGGDDPSVEDGSHGLCKKKKKKARDLPDLQNKIFCYVWSAFHRFYPFLDAALHFLFSTLPMDIGTRTLPVIK